MGKFSSWAIFTRNNKFLKKETFQWLLFIRWGRFLETPIFSTRKWVPLLQTLEIVICPQWKSILHKHPLSWSSRQAHSPPEASWVIVLQKVLALLPKTLCPNHTLTLWYPTFVIIEWASYGLWTNTSPVSTRKVFSNRRNLPALLWTWPESFMLVHASPAEDHHSVCLLDLGRVFKINHDDHDRKVDQNG